VGVFNDSFFFPGTREEAKHAIALIRTSFNVVN
jgi:hypothetical protein